MVKNKEIFSIRKFKTGTHSALIGKLGVVAATALAIGLSGATASADEVTTVSTTPAVEVVNPNPATNLETVQEAPTAEAVVTEAEAGTQTGELVSPVTSPELDAAVTSAQEAGVSITAETTPVAHESLDAAQADLANQTAEVIAAEEKQVENTTEIKEAEATNADIDRQNQAEAERVAEYNEQGQAAVDQLNAAGQAAVDARNAAGQAAVDARNQKELDDRDAEAAAVAQRNKDGQAAVDARNAAGQAAVDARNAAGQAAVDARNAAGQAAVDARNAQAVAKRESEAEAVEARNKDGQEAVDARNKSGQAMTDAINKAEQERANLENARLKAEYEAKLAKIADVEAYNAEIRKRNAEAIANAEADNARLKAEYEAKKAEMQAKTKEDGYLSTVEYNNLIYRHSVDPKVKVSNLNGIVFTDWVKNNDKGHAYVLLGSTGGGDKQYSDQTQAPLADTWDPYSPENAKGGAYTMYAPNGSYSFTATYTNVDGVTVDGVAPAKIVYEVTYSDKNNIPTGVILYEDPADFMDWAQGTVEAYPLGDLTVGIKFYDASGNRIELANTSIFHFETVDNNHQGHGTIEKISVTGGELLKVNGSTVTIHNDGKAYSDNDNASPEVLTNGHEVWRNSVAFKPTDNDFTITFTKTAQTDGSAQNYMWAGIGSNYEFGLPPLPPYKQITPEQEKEVPTKPVEPTYVTPTLRTFTPEVFVPEEYTPAPFVPEVFTPETFTPETFTPETFTPEDYTPDPFVPETFTPETFTPETFDPITPVVIPYVTVPEKKVFEASVHPVLVKQTPANSKDVINEDGVSVDGKLVPKGATEKWTLTNANLKAGRAEVTAYVMNDPFPAGFEIDRTATAAENTAWTVSYDENGKATLTATAATLNLLNANRNQDVVVPVAYFVGRPINDGGTYKNTFTTIITTPTGEYKVVSNTPVIYTPGSEDPRNPGGENPTPYDSLIEPKKDVVDENGTSIDGQSILPNTTLNYVAEQDLDQYKGIAASQNAIGKGFFYVDDYLDAAIDGSSLVVNSIKAANGDDVRAMLDMIHVLSADTLDEKLQALIKESGISPVGEFYLWVAKDPQAFFKAYVEQGLDITYNLSFKVKQDFVGTVTNQTYQIDFGNGYYGNIVTNELPQLVVHKDVLDKDGKSIDGGTVKIGDLLTYKLEGWVIPAGRGYDIKEYRFVDLLQVSHDEYQTYEIKAKVGFTLADGTVIKAGDDLKGYTETVYNAETGKFETRFREDFLNQIPRTSAFGADGFITVKRIAAGEVVNEYTLYVNGNPVVSNKVITETPEPPKPETPTPTPQTPAPAPAGPSLPNTGSNASQALSIAGIGGLMLSVLAQFGLVKRKAKED
ncbi:LPXTG cell wall anchor domain-containing protein [Streptococcus suis]|uniref:SspB-related isopeptide-forming adhesin n=1 Tax=Streptococcus suis TaxID=1307 RepID=UPI001C9C99FA|nr:SspB-related isopeptide-forming adhesin [Streptococcus suis]QZS51627.1 LPXTG cell wall anchor domain-containing protein [Streptococcus suis]QZS52037.1 LPXTG cell wall anchor domain-containing protein [Streptococcus suis]HEM3522874.1 LPXTG cell wall anchor domain-containing protein [Streptococcus suis]